MFKKIYVTNTTTYTYPIKRMDIVLLHNVIASKLQQSGIKSSIGFASAAGLWQGIGGENRVISIVERGLFIMFVTVCYTQTNVQIQICYSPQLKNMNYTDSVHAMRYSQWQMCINTVMTAVESSIFEIAGECASCDTDYFG